MSRKKNPQNNQTKNVRRNNRRAAKTNGISLPVRYRLLLLGCGLFLIVGFFFAARQHFASMDFSMKNSRLRKMSAELEDDKRRLLLAKEIALSPAEIKKAAQKIGFTTKTAVNSAAATVSNSIATTAKSVKTDIEPKPSAEKSVPAKVVRAIAEKTNELAADVKSVVKKASEAKTPPNVKVKRETTHAER
ncbi:MAG: hypothetical protein H0U87_04970 [Acidobacteria bacterium]|nr:hypothetical protein [Acidobacteriota bacterium]